MAGMSRRRARRDAAILEMGGVPPKWQDNRPVKKPLNTERHLDPVKPAMGRGPVAVVPTAAPDDRALELVLRGVTGDELDEESSAQFDELRAMSFGFAREMMALPLDINHKHFSKILSVKQAIATALLTATVRVRPGDLRDKDDDGVGALLAAVKAAGGALAETDEDRARRELLS
jgi:hypothetical protein